MDKTVTRGRSLEPNQIETMSCVLFLEQMHFRDQKVHRERNSLKIELS